MKPEFEQRKVIIEPEVLQKMRQDLEAIADDKTLTFEQQADKTKAVVKEVADFVGIPDVILFEGFNMWYAEEKDREMEKELNELYDKASEEVKEACRSLVPKYLTSARSLPPMFREVYTRSFIEIELVPLARALNVDVNTILTVFEKELKAFVEK